VGVGSSQIVALIVDAISVYYLISTPSFVPRAYSSFVVPKEEEEEEEEEVAPRVLAPRSTSEGWMAVEWGIAMYEGKIIVLKKKLH
jgi:hypothetical protein